MPDPDETAPAQERPALSVAPVALSDWDALAAQFADGNFEQTAAYAEAGAARLGARAEAVAVLAGDRPIAAALVRIKTVPVLGRGIAYIPSGPLLARREGPAPDMADLQAVLTALSAYFSGGGGHILRLRLPIVSPLLDRAGPEAMAALGFAPTGSAPDYTSFVVDLSASEEALRKGLHSKWRGHLNKAEKSGLTLDLGHSESHQARFLALLDEVQSAKRFDIELTPRFFFPLQDPAFHRDVLIATHEGQDVGAVTLARTRDVGIYHFGATAHAGRPLRAGYFLIWNAMLLCAREGVRWFDLGGVDAETNPDVFSFKKRVGGPERHAGAYECRPGGALGGLVAAVEQGYRRLRRARRG